MNFFWLTSRNNFIGEVTIIYTNFSADPATGNPIKQVFTPGQDPAIGYVAVF